MTCSQPHCSSNAFQYCLQGLQIFWWTNRKHSLSSTKPKLDLAHPSFIASQLHPTSCWWAFWEPTACHLLLLLGIIALWAGQTVVSAELWFRRKPWMPPSNFCGKCFDYHWAELATVKCLLFCSMGENHTHNFRVLQWRREDCRNRSPRHRPAEI